MEGVTSHYDRFALRSSGRITGEELPRQGARRLGAPARDAGPRAPEPRAVVVRRVDQAVQARRVEPQHDGELLPEGRARDGRARSPNPAAHRGREEPRRRAAPAVDALRRAARAAPRRAAADVRGGDRALARRRVRRGRSAGTDDPELVEELAARRPRATRQSPDPAQIADGLHAVWLGATTSGHARSPACSTARPRRRRGCRRATRSSRSTASARPATATCATCSGRASRRPRARRRCSAATSCSSSPSTLAAAPPTRWEIVGHRGCRAPRRARYQAWLGEPHPGAQCARHGHHDGALGVTLLRSSAVTG